MFYCSKYPTSSEIKYINFFYEQKQKPSIDMLLHGIDCISAFSSANLYLPLQPISRRSHPISFLLWHAQLRSSFSWAVYYGYHHCPKYPKCSNIISTFIPYPHHEARLLRSDEHSYLEACWILLKSDFNNPFFIFCNLFCQLSYRQHFNLS